MSIAETLKLRTTTTRLDRFDRMRAELVYRACMTDLSACSPLVRRMLAQEPVTTDEIQAAHAALAERVGKLEHDARWTRATVNLTGQSVIAQSPPISDVKAEPIAPEPAPARTRGEVVAERMVYETQTDILRIDWKSRSVGARCEQNAATARQWLREFIADAINSERADAAAEARRKAIGECKKFLVDNECPGMAGLLDTLAGGGG